MIIINILKLTTAASEQWSYDQKIWIKIFL